MGRVETDVYKNLNSKCDPVDNLNVAKLPKIIVQIYLSAPPSRLLAQAQWASVSPHRRPAVSAHPTHPSRTNHLPDRVVVVDCASHPHLVLVKLLHGAGVAARSVFCASRSAVSVFCTNNGRSWRALRGVRQRPILCLG